MDCEGKDMMGMMSKMMKGCDPEQMADMMSQWVGAMLQQMPKEKRTDFVMKAVGIFMEHGTAGMSESEKKDLRGKVAEKIQH